jgi:sporulation protein YlmC with PRC-barrel domain
MLIAGSRLIDAPVMGLQTGGELARTSAAIIDPRTLEIVAYELSGPLLDSHPSLLRIADVREFSDIGLIVDSSDEFVAPEDIIKLNDIYKLGFNLFGMQVIDTKKRKLGKIDGYTIETTGFVVQQLSVKRPLLKSFGDTHLLIHRTQITEINNSAIIVNSEAKKQTVVQTVQGAYHNPFRKNPNTQTEHVEQD